jgi:hypothetical protein
MTEEIPQAKKGTISPSVNNDNTHTYTYVDTGEVCSQKEKECAIFIKADETDKTLYLSFLLLDQPLFQWQLSERTVASYRTQQTG